MNSRRTLAIWASITSLTVPSCRSAYGGVTFAAEAFAEASDSWGWEPLTQHDLSPLGNAHARVDPGYGWAEARVDGTVVGVGALSDYFFGFQGAKGVATSRNQWAVSSVTHAAGSVVYAQLGLSFSGRLELWDTFGWGAFPPYGEAVASGLFRVEAGGNVIEHSGGISALAWGGSAMSSYQTSGAWSSGSVTEDWVLDSTYYRWVHRYDFTLTEILSVPVELGGGFNAEFTLEARTASASGEVDNGFLDEEGNWIPIIEPVFAGALADFRSTGSLTVLGASLTQGGPLDPNIAIFQVPEPSSYAIVAGLGLVAFGFWRRRAAR